MICGLALEDWKECILGFELSWVCSYYLNLCLVRMEMGLIVEPPLRVAQASEWVSESQEEAADPQ